jgi:2-polyprenyl-3-methyl-5-hydroxy-6-metoxy-1,4-benzoquinol methylase
MHTHHEVRYPVNRRWWNVSQRVLHGELMDDPAIDRQLHGKALDGLTRLNRASHAVGHMWQAIAPLAGTVPLRVLDVAAGAGDVPVGLWQTARRRGVQLDIDACDRSATAVDYGRALAARCGAQVRFMQIDVLRRDIRDLGGYDVVTCSLFLHHLTDDQAVHVLGAMAKSARRLVTVSDLVRSRGGLMLAWSASRMLTGSRVVHVDAERSVRAAFTCDEARKLARRAGMDTATVSWCWPWRWQLRWNRS